MTRHTLARGVLASAFVATLSLSGNARAQIPPPPPLTHAPGDGPHVDGYVGMEFATLARSGGGANYEQFTVRGLSRQPYVLKVADIHFSGLGRFEAGLNGAATSLVALGGFTSENQTSQADLGQAERYAALLGYALGKHITLRGEGAFAHMVTYAAPSFHRTGGNALTTYFVPESGAPRRLSAGANVLGNTDWYSLAVTAVVDGQVYGLNWLKDLSLGYRFIRVSTLSSYLASTGDYVDSVLQGIVQDTFACHAAAARQNLDFALWSDVHLTGHAYFFLGYSSVSSGFVDTSGGVCLGRGGSLAITYTQPHWSFVVGVNYEEVVALQVAGGNTIQSTMPYSDWHTGRIGVARAGSQWSVSSPAEAFQVFAPFARLTVSY